MSRRVLDRVSRTDPYLPADWWRELDRAVVIDRLGRNRPTETPFGRLAVPPLYARVRTVPSPQRSRGA